MHIILIYKLVTSPLEIENQSKVTRVPKTKENYKKNEKSLQKCVYMGI